MSKHIINGQKISTNYDYPPIPIRDYDWSATSEDFDASYEGPEDGGWIGSHPIGHGRTEAEAIADYLDQIAAEDPTP
jgi:hypothetical protein